MSKKIRVRFAPSPTGFMHLGNVRTALINYLFAHKKHGKFVLRVEDTDAKRNVDEAGLEILRDLKWLGLKYDEGPIVGGNYGPYFQSERVKIYQEFLSDLIESQKVYRCFCSEHTLQRKREEQLKQGKPPRYDRTCRNLSDDKIKQKLVDGQKFIWRLKINSDQMVEVDSMARGKMTFDMKNFYDFALTRPDESFTFMFANFIDDWLMKITNVIRGEDHLSNTAMQAALYDAFAFPLPMFWHLPMLCNTDGKKLSKRDFGFSLKDLQSDGFLPQAICNYLAIIGASFEQEIQSLGELTKSFDFDHIHTTGAIRFDLEKLTWVNHKWIERLSLEHLAEYIKPFLYEQIPASKSLDNEKLEYILSKLRTDMKVLKDVGSVLQFYFQAPKVSKEEIEEKNGAEKTETILSLIKQYLDQSDKADFFLDILKKDGKERGLKMREILGPVRYLLTGKFAGPSLHDLFEILEDDEIKRRLGILI